MSRRLRALALAALAWGGPAVARGAETGWVEGVIKAKPRTGVDVKRDAGGAYARQEFRDATFFDYEHPGSFVLYLAPTTNAPLELTETAVEVQLATKNGKLRLVPDFFVVPIGGTVLFKNVDAEDRNLYAVSSSVRNMNIRVGAGVPRPVKCGRFGPVFLRSLDDNTFSATAFIATRYAVVTDKDGAYRIEAPVGVYSLGVWHPRLPPQFVQVAIQAGKGLKNDFTLSVDSLSR